MTALVALVLASPTPILADSYDEQIKALKAQASDQANQAAALHNQADNYRARVSELNAQITALNTQIRINQLKSNHLNTQIVENQAKIADQKTILGDIVKTMYFDSTVSPLEMLASSSNISDFLDQEQYRESVKSKIQDSMIAIETLQKSLEDQQAQLARAIADQQAQQQQLAASQAEVNNLLAVAAQNAAAADSQVKNSNAEITRLKAEQAAALAAKYGNNGLVGGGACGGGYPGKWCNAPQDSLVDNWGMYNRECVSYTAFKVAVSGRSMPYWGGRGNAKQWPGNASAAGIAVDGNPRAGDVAISTAGPYGHAMYVEAVLSNGRVHVSQYNWGNNGEYSEMTIPASGLYFIHF